MTDSDSEDPIRVPNNANDADVMSIDTLKSSKTNAEVTEDSIDSTSLTSVLEDFNTKSEKDAMVESSEPIIQETIVDTPDEASRESYHTAPEIMVETPKCLKMMQPTTSQRRRAIYKRSESKNERRYRKDRLLRAVESRMQKLEFVRKQKHHLSDDLDEKIEDILTRDLLLLSGDRHGPFVGRPR